MPIFDAEQCSQNPERIGLYYEQRRLPAAVEHPELPELVARFCYLYFPKWMCSAIRILHALMGFLHAEAVSVYTETEYALSLFSHKFLLHLFLHAGNIPYAPCRS